MSRTSRSSPVVMMVGLLVWSVLAQQVVAQPASAGPTAASRSVIELNGSPAQAPDLPPPALVRQALATQPSVLAAQADVLAETAQGARLRAGPYESVFIAGAQSRRVDDPMARYGEWSVGMERGLRRAGKANIDDALGKQGVRIARAMLAESRHEAARLLLQDWFACLREAAQASEWDTQVALLGRQQEVVQRRLRAGDASRLELEQAGAALDQAQAQQALAQARQAAASAEFSARHGFAAPSSVTPVEPRPLDHTEPSWRAQVLQMSHALAVAREGAGRARLLAQRADADRRPDPTIGVHLGHERGGAERLLGLTLAVPIGGAARAASADQSLALAQAADQREAALRRRLEAEVSAQYARAVGTQQGWERLARAAQRLDSTARLAERAYALGEGTITDVLSARRLALEARLSVVLAQLDANFSRYRLLLDAHQLWDFEED
jgi:cobalt-zinc-cadmium efflux system outer membrane protein